ncbi:MAG: hypothetical protein RIG82_03650 [Phycisphaeraceae bacterium]
MRAAVFLARDGAILADERLAEEGRIVLAKGAASAVASICGLGYRVVMLAPETADEGRRDAEIGRLIEDAANGARIDQVCRYPAAVVAGRKRKVKVAEALSGSVEQLAVDLNIDMGRSWLIGVEEDQIEAGLARGVRTILLDAASEGVVPPAGSGVMAAYRSGSLVEAVRIVAQQRKPEVQEEIHKAEQGGRRWDVAAIARIQRAREEPLTQEDLETAARAAGVEAPERAKPREGGAVTTVLPSVSRPKVEEVELEPRVEAKKDEAKREEVEKDGRVEGRGEVTAEGRLLKQILGELRSQRVVKTGVSPLHLVAMLLEVVAVVCVIGALWMAAGDSELFWRWAWMGVMVQLGAIVALLMHERSS